MKLSLATLAPLVALLQPALANFDIYAVGSSLNGNIEWGWQIFDYDPDCRDVVYNFRFYHTYGDVSGSEAFRCVGDCHKDGRADGIEVLEMRLKANPLYHFTIYKESNYILWGTDNLSYGECFPFPANGFNCPTFGGPMVGERKFRCLSQFTAGQMARTS